jgi:glutamyl-tRNA reductase
MDIIMDKLMDELYIDEYDEHINEHIDMLNNMVRDVVMKNSDNGTLNDITVKRDIFDRVEGNCLKIYDLDDLEHAMKKLRLS